MHNLLCLLIIAIISAVVLYTCNEGFAPYSIPNPVWHKIGMAISLSNQYENDLYILEQKAGENKYRVFYTYGTIPTIFELKGNHPVQNGQIREGEVKGLSSTTVLRKDNPLFKLVLSQGAQRYDDKAIKDLKWKPVAYGAPHFNHYTKDLYMIYERKFSEKYRIYKAKYIFSELPENWFLKGSTPLINGEIRESIRRPLSGPFLKLKVTLLSPDYEPKKYSLTARQENYENNWKIVGRAGLINATGRLPFFNYILEENRPDAFRYHYRIYNPELKRLEYINLQGTHKAETDQVRSALTNVFSQSLQGDYQLQINY